MRSDKKYFLCARVALAVQIELEKRLHPNNTNERLLSAYQELDRIFSLIPNTKRRINLDLSDYTYESSIREKERDLRIILSPFPDLLGHVEEVSIDIMSHTFNKNTVIPFLEIKYQVESADQQNTNSALQIAINALGLEASRIEKILLEITSSSSFRGGLQNLIEYSLNMHYSRLVLIAYFAYTE
jgi:hypothetical protein